MPTIFISGNVTFKIKCSSDETKDLKLALKNNEQGLIFEYEENEIPCVFYLYPFHIVSGSLTVKPDGGDGDYGVVFDGVSKIPVNKSTIDYLAKKDSSLYIAGLKGDNRRLRINGDVEAKILSPLKISKTAPK